jgi:hypothetical protein
LPQPCRRRTSGGHDAAPVAKRLQLAVDGDMIAFATILELF